LDETTYGKRPLERKQPRKVEHSEKPRPLGRKNQKLCPKSAIVLITNKTSEVILIVLVLLYADNL